MFRVGASILLGIQVFPSKYVANTLCIDFCLSYAK